MGLAHFLLVGLASSWHFWAWRVFRFFAHGLADTLSCTFPLCMLGSRVFSSNGLASTLDFGPSDYFDLGLAGISSVGLSEYSKPVDFGLASILIF